MKFVEKNGYTFVYLDENFLNEYEYEISYNESLMNEWMFVSSKLETGIALMSKQEVYEHLLSIFDMSLELETNEKEIQDILEDSVKTYAEILFVFPINNV